MKRTVFIILLLLVMSSSNRSRAQIQIQALKKGDVVPNLIITVNNGDSIYNTCISDYKGKLLLLDFWGVHCGSCIASMPEMLELQEKFDNKIQILFVTADKDEDVKRLMKKYNKMNSSTPWVDAAKHLSFVNQDTILSVLFPHKVQPTHVWIDGNQIVRALAYSNTTTAETIQDFLSGKEINLNEQNFIDLDYDDPVSWLVKGNIDNLQYYSFITNHLENGGDERVLNVKTDLNTSKTIGFNCLNSPILELYKLAYVKDWVLSNQSIPDNRIVVETKNKKRFYQPENADRLEWWQSNTFCYSLKIPLSQSDRVYHIMQQDLNRFFNLTSKIETRKVKCMILKQISLNDSLRSKHFVSKGQQVLKHGKLIFALQDASMGELFRHLNNIIFVQRGWMPFLNETNYKGKIDIELPWEENPHSISIASLRKSLQRYGLDLVEEYRNMNMLVIKDNR